MSAAPLPITIAKPKEITTSSALYVIGRVGEMLKEGEHSPSRKQWADACRANWPLAWVYIGRDNVAVHFKGPSFDSDFIFVSRLPDWRGNNI